MSKATKKRKVLANTDSHPNTPGGGGSSNASSDDESLSGSHSGGKLSVRKETEQRRRNMMNQHFDELVMMLSMVTDRVNPKKMDKTSILEEVVRVIRQYYDLDKCPVPSRPPEYKPGFFSRGDLFEFLLDALGAFLMFVSGNGRILYCSDLITSLTGHMPTRLVGQTIYDCIVPDDQHKIKAQFLPLPEVNGIRIPASPIIAYPPRKFTCSIRLYSNDPSNMSTSRTFTCLSYLRQWADDGEPDPIDAFEDKSNNECSSCILLLGKLADKDSPKDHSITTNDVNFEFSMRVSKEGKVLEVDKQASLILGFTRRDIQGASFFDYVDPYHSAKIGEAIEMFLSKGLGVSQPYRLLSKSGQYIWVVSKGFLSYNPWNHKPDHVLLQSKVLGCDEVLPEYKFKVDTAKIPNTIEDYTPTNTHSTSSEPTVIQPSAVQPSAAVSNNTRVTVTSTDGLPTNSVRPSTLMTDMNRPDPMPSLAMPSSVSSSSPYLPFTNNGHMMAPPQPSGNRQQETFENMAQQLERKNQELFELQRRMLEQQQLFEQERRQFYQVTNQVMTYIGKNEGISVQSYLDPNLSMAIGNTDLQQQSLHPSPGKATSSFNQQQAPPPAPMKHSFPMNPFGSSTPAPYSQSLPMHYLNMADSQLQSTPNSQFPSSDNTTPQVYSNNTSSSISVPAVESTGFNSTVVPVPPAPAPTSSTGIHSGFPPPNSSSSVNNNSTAALSYGYQHIPAP